MNNTNINIKTKDETQAKRKNKYVAGDKIGPYETELLQRLENRRGIFKCSFCGQKFESYINHVARGSKKSCGCQNKHYKSGEKLGPNNTELVEYTYVDKHRKWHGKFICSECGKIFESDICGVVKGNARSCGCLKDKNFYNNSRSYCYKELTGQKSGTWTALRRTNKQSKNHTWYWECVCENGHHKEILSSNFGRVLTCSECNLGSYGERIIKESLEQLCIQFETQYSFADCCYVNPLLFDFYLPDYNCCIEYDGEQHFEETHFFNSDSLDKRKERDNIKNQYCSNHNIRLIRIPYWDKAKINKEYIKELLNNE